MNKEIHLDKTKSIKYIQDIFQSEFPFLRIDFYSAPQKAKPRFKLTNPNTTLGQLAENILPGVIQIDEKKKVGDLEAELKSRFGLNVQVLRKSGNSWLETTLTDDWTLEKQNKEGELLHNTPILPNDEVIDKDLLDPE
ncbi:MAG: hypothetical protein C5B59_05540 [Bacteroidetes bacterium]|nr:MAG: hypothetical protein C5B59_05540 [Bacteroidota bacterium]